MGRADNQQASNPRQYTICDCLQFRKSNTTRNQKIRVAAGEPGPAGHPRRSSHLTSLLSLAIYSSAAQGNPCARHEPHATDRPKNTHTKAHRTDAARQPPFGTSTPTNTKGPFQPRPARIAARPAKIKSETSITAWRPRFLVDRTPRQKKPSLGSHAPA